MNEEEKEAIKDLEEMIELYEDECLLTTENDIKYIKVILNLVEKQERVIKTRLKEIESLYKMMSVKDDKIEKIKEELRDIIFEFLPKSNHEVVLRAKIIKLLGE